MSMSGEVNEVEKKAMTDKLSAQLEPTETKEQEVSETFLSSKPFIAPPKIPGNQVNLTETKSSLYTESDREEVTMEISKDSLSQREEKAIVSTDDTVINTNDDKNIPVYSENVDIQKTRGVIDDNEVPSSFPSFLQETDMEESFVNASVLAKATEEELLDRGWNPSNINDEKPNSFPSFLQDKSVNSGEDHVVSPVIPNKSLAEHLESQKDDTITEKDNFPQSVVLPNESVKMQEVKAEEEGISEKLNIAAPVPPVIPVSSESDDTIYNNDTKMPFVISSQNNDTDTEKITTYSTDDEDEIKSVDFKLDSVTISTSMPPTQESEVPSLTEKDGEGVSMSDEIISVSSNDILDEEKSSFAVSPKTGPGYQTDNKAKPPVAKDIETLKLETVHDEEAQASEESLIRPILQSEELQETEEKEVSDYKSANFLAELFANGNECITAPNGSFSVQENIRQLLALFSNGRFFVAESAKFDGRVLGLEYKARKRRLQVGKPEYVPTIVLNDIYEYVVRSQESVQPTELENQEQARMQRDFVTIISRAAMERVSDIHIVVADHTTVMFRVNGLMQTEMEYNKEWGESFVRAAFASSDISDSNYAQNEYQAAQKLGRTPLRGSNGRLVLPRNVLGIRLQFNPIAFGTRYVVMRLLYAEENADSISDLEVLGFTKHESDLFYQLRSVPTGIVIISGPTGSGKSTTLQRNMIAMLRERNYEVNLITVEDPPEYPIPGARQMPVTNASIEEAKDREFTRALSAALRSDPDSLMIGEVRTLSAADLAFRGALSGHNVWTTLHANSAPAVLMRLKDMGVEDFKLQDPDIMKGMLAQRLFRKVCPYCRVSAATRLDHPAVQRLRRAFGDVGLNYAFLRGAGCKECDFRGVRGRTVVSEFILPDATFLDLMIRGESKKAINYWINDLDGRTLRDGALARMLEGIIDVEEVERWTGFLDQQIIS